MTRRAHRGGSCLEFKDVVSEDVGFEHDMLLTINNLRCGIFTSEADIGEGLKLQYVETPHPETPHP